jgi:hypothetical protein
MPIHTPRGNKSATPTPQDRDLFLATLVEEDIRGWAVRSKPKRLVTPSGTQYPLHLLGDGSFATAYEIGTRGIVVAEVHDVGGKPVDYSKTVLAELLDVNQDILHLPRVVYLGTTGVSELFGMPKYKVPLNKKKNPLAWAQADILQQCSDRAQSLINHKFATRGYQARAQTITCATKNRSIPRTLVHDLTLLSKHADQFGTGNLFEFPARNLGTDEHGNLILLDVLFDIKALRAAQRAAKKNAARKNFSPLAAWFDSVVSPGVIPG